MSLIDNHTQVTFKKDVDQRLQSLALTNDQFLRAQRNLLYLSTQLMNIEERVKFLKRCIISKRLPSSYQVQALHLGVGECIDEDSLEMAYKKNCELLTSKKENFEKATECISKQVDHCFKDILLRFVSQQSAYELNEIKKSYIQEFRKIETEDTKKNIRRLHFGHEGTSVLKYPVDCYLRKTERWFHHQMSNHCKLKYSYGHQRNNLDDSHSQEEVAKQRTLKPSKLRRLERRAAERKELAQSIVEAALNAAIE